jgi:glyoxylase-like metal-dependent hydrolase (beta-lactamase superfamily II)
VVWFPEECILATGDLFGWGLIPCTRPLTPDVRERLLGIYDEMIACDPKTVIPGHGPLATGDHLRRFVQYVQDLCDEARKRAAEGQSVAQIVAGIAPPQDMADWWRFADWKHGNSAERVARAAKQGHLD